MSISSRVNKNISGQIMVPMNLEGTSHDQNFMSTAKLITLGAMVLGTILLVVRVHSLKSLVARLLGYAVIIFIDQLIVRKIVLQEEYYAKVYKKTQQYNVATPDVFWNIPNIQDTYHGAVLMYADGKVGMVLRAERDTITGKKADFTESHYDAISDFYREINRHGLRLVQLNIMEPAGKDPRINSLDSLVTSPSNPNLSKLMEMQIGEIRKMTRETLYETEYFIIYSQEGMAKDKLLAAISDCAIQLLNGAYIHYTLLDRKECLELMKELYGVSYFDYGKAAVSVFRNSGISVSKAFDVKAVRYTDGRLQEIDKTGNIRLSNLASYVLKGDLQPGEWTVEDALAGKVKNRNNVAQQGTGATRRVGDVQKPEEVGDVYFDLDNDEFGVYSAPTEQEPVINLQDQEGARKRGKIGRGQKRGVKAREKKSERKKKGGRDERTVDEIVEGSEGDFQQFELDGDDEIKVPMGDDDFIDI